MNSGPLFVVCDKRGGKWRELREFGLHATEASARRAYMTALDPDLLGSPDAFVYAHWNKFRRVEPLQTRRIQ